MLSSKQILVSALSLCALAPNLTACGQTGPLYLPTKQSAPSTTIAPLVSAHLPTPASYITP